ncbi:hypothetical protein ABB37_03375 [Leptomonas pyrrhocoris]|uniref:Uncharacterized protein n=1 Tax=Leptomonas pyrrhocoris TaxID=157538 RepID=A0A0M9G4U3_LEPPY|nr:hypothetical protein ABB37_03375 [Leptomonas pyrrhocoris]KPA82267.1 hypothetical protein ABB37_03375 [Leptomonas pyrrhocoris]|eukprot:XP_015660706.1 hypothetical protein ABB37_03375 [Leptomonas pyrrhocoris]
MMPSPKSLSAAKATNKANASPSRKGSATAAVLIPTMEAAPRLNSHRPVKASDKAGSARLEGVEVFSTRPRAVVPQAIPPAIRSSAPAKLPSRKARSTPPLDAAGNNLSNRNIGSSSSSMATERAGQRSEPPALPLHRATTSHDISPSDSEESEAGIVESSRSYLTRLSLEDAVVALERLRFLMMSHTAAVTGSQADKAESAAVQPPQQTHVDPFKLSKRPLEDIAEELCSQLRRLTTAYAVASAADRCLLGVSDGRPPSQPSISIPSAQEKLLAAPSFDAAAGGVQLLGTFGPMVSTQQLMTTVRSNAGDGNFLDSPNSVGSDGSCGAIDLHKPNPGPRIAYPPRECSEGALDFGSTVYKYPNGTVVTFPISTFGELVSTESGQGTTLRSRGNTFMSTERRITVSDGTQTDDSLGPMKKEKELQAYVKALEARLTEKQRLEAMRESRGTKKSGNEDTLSRLIHSVGNAKAQTAKQSSTSAHAHGKASNH